MKVKNATEFTRVAEELLQQSALILVQEYVDMKMTSRGTVVIEVNDNPNIDAGAEDSTPGDELYRIVLREFVRRLDLLHCPAQGMPC
jgi:glutathione synthase/RimK-type ligase-like ATP-grasp enzyme